MTSNIGLKEFNEQAEIGFDVETKNDQEKTGRDYQKLKEKITEQLQDFFRPEFLNRLDKIIIFKPLDNQAALKITELQLTELKNRVADQGYELKFSPKVIEKIVKIGFIPKEGARTIRRTIQEYLEAPLAQKILESEFKLGGVINVKINKDNIVFE